jgi:16S rRNA processing protein RimM
VPASAPGSPQRPRLLAGRVGRAHGLDGSFYVTMPNAELLELGSELLLGGARRLVVRRAGTDRRPIIRLEGCEDRTAAEALRGQDLAVAPENVPELPEGEWWADQLEGCRVHDAGRPVGVVRRLLALPSCEVLEVDRDGGGELLVPMVSDAVRNVDIEAREVEVDLHFLGVEPGPSSESAQ